MKSKLKNIQKKNVMTRLNPKNQLEIRKLLKMKLNYSEKEKDIILKEALKQKR